MYYDSFVGLKWINMWVCFNRRVVLKFILLLAGYGLSCSYIEFFTLIKTGIIFVVPSLTQLVKSMYVYFCTASFKNSYCFF